MVSRIAVQFAASLLVGVPMAWAQIAPGEARVIVTQGQASVKRAPDQAWVSIAAEARAATPAEAQRMGADAMTAVQVALTKAAVPSDAVRTTGYSLRPDLEYENGRSRVLGYIVNNQIEVRVDDLAKLGAVLDAAGASGATSMSGLRFDLKDRATVEREALRLAVEDAVARAQAVAAGAGAALGSILRIDERGEAPVPGPVMTMRLQSERTSPTPVSPGEVEISAQVTLTVGIR